MILLLGYGFLGSAVYKALKKSGQQVKVISRTVPQNNSDFISADITAIKFLEKEFVGIKTVIHCIHTTVPASSILDETYDIQSNLIPFVAILNLCKENKVENFIYVSSGGAVYGSPLNDKALTEDHSTNPLSSYGITKLASEKYLIINRGNFKGNCIVLRPSNIYGFGQRTSKPQGIIGHALNACINNLELTIWGSGEGKKDYLHIDDFVNALLKVVLYKNRTEKIIYNLASGELLTINQIIETIENKFKSKINKKFLQQKKYDIPSISLDSSLFEKQFNWSAKNNFKKFIADYEY